jgi:enoyl-[acyl-carrier protein] reductase II
MIKTQVCEVLGIEHPIVQAGMTAGTTASLCAAVSEAGALGSISASLRSPDDLELQIAKIRDLTGRPFAVNFVVPIINEDSFQRTLASRPSVIALTAGDPMDLIPRAHDVGALVTVQVNTVEQAERSAAAGADVIIAQGGESGGFAGLVGTMALVPQVVDAVRPLPVLAAGGIADGRGLAAALLLGAQGVNMGTRFLASHESPADDVWTSRIINATAEEAEKHDFLSVMIPPVPTRWPVAPRAFGSDFIEKWRQLAAAGHADAIDDEVMSLAQQGRLPDALPFAGQTAGAIRDTEPAGDIVRRVVAEAEQLLRAAPSFVA